MTAPAHDAAGATAVAPAGAAAGTAPGPGPGRRRPRALRLQVRALLTLAALLVTGCTGAVSPPPAPDASALAPMTLAPGGPPPAPTGPTDWLTYHHDAARTGLAPGVPAPSTLRRAWAAKLDGAVYGQPLVVRGLVVAATENDSLYGLDATTGRVRWRTHLGEPAALSSLPCGGIDPLGITSTPVYEPSTGLVFALAELSTGRHVLVGLDPATGTVRVRREAEPPHGDFHAHQQRGALAAVGGRILIAYGGLEGDCGNYLGSVVSVPASGAGPLLSYAVPSKRQAGIWAPSGPVVVAAPGSGSSSTVLVSVGNGAATGGGWDGSDSVVALSPATLQREGAFAPAVWAQDNAADLDLGSLGPVPVGPFVLTVGKRGTGYVLGPGRLGRAAVGGEVAQAALCQAFGGAAVAGQTVYLPCTDRLLRVDIDALGRPHPGWRLALGAAGSPVLGGGAVFVPDYANGVLYALSQRTGAVLAQAATGPLPHFASPVLSGARVLLGTRSGVIAFTGA